MKNIRASVDIGSNSILLLAVDMDHNMKVLENEANVTGLGRNLDTTKNFIDIAMKESLEVLKEYSRRCYFHGIKPEDIIATATEAARVAQNSKEFFNRVLKETGINVLIISGEAEAYYSTHGILFDKRIKDESILIMDIGGASTEIISVDTQTKKINDSFSMPMGAVRVSNWIEAGMVAQNLENIFKKFEEKISKLSYSKLHCVAGTMTSVGNMYLGEPSFCESKVNGLEFSVADMEKLNQKYNTWSPEQYLECFPFLGKRSQTIAAGIILATEIFKKLKIKNLYISTYGLRYGTLLSGGIKNEFIRNT